MITKDSTILQPHWRGLGGWNFYFLLKILLFVYGYLNLHLFDNLVFMAFLLLPLKSDRLHRVRGWIALPIGIALLYNDTSLPSFTRVLVNAKQLSGFSFDYMLELVLRFIHWPLLGGLLVLFIAYLFINQWIRLTTINVILLAVLNLNMMPLPNVNNSNLTASNVPAGNSTLPPSYSSLPIQATLSEVTQGATTNQALNSYLQNFYQTEKQRYTQFPSTLASDAVPFDTLIINICSLGWSDLAAVDLLTHPIWQHFDALFSRFNSATSYSGPASIRLLRASCGQEPHQMIYKPAESHCLLLDNLAALGFRQELAMDHSGQYDDYLNGLRKHDGLQASLMSQSGLPVELKGFDGEPIYDSAALFNRWLQQRMTTSAEQRTITFFNLIALHDGNRFIDKKRDSTYHGRAKYLLDQLDGFLTQLEQSGRKMLVIMVPEHGAALAGDKMQISGLRDIPTPSVTQIPVGIKLVGIRATAPASTIQLSQPVSYLAISEIIARLVDGKVFTQEQIDWSGLLQNLPETAAVSENSGSVVIDYQNVPYVQLNKQDWLPYPQ